MRTNSTRSFPPQLEVLRVRFADWRRTRKIGSRIPEPLWLSAVKLAADHGINRTATALGVDYYTLKKRMEEKSVSRSRAASVNGAAFVELTAPAVPVESAAAGQMAARECILELENVAGSKLRIHLKGIEAPDVAALSRSLWGVE